MSWEIVDEGWGRVPVSSDRVGEEPHPRRPSPWTLQQLPSPSVRERARPTRDCHLVVVDTVLQFTTAGRTTIVANQLRTTIDASSAPTTT